MRLGVEAVELKRVKSSIGTEGAAKLVFDKVFKKDIERLLSMDDLWKTRTKPKSMDFETLSRASKEATLPTASSIEFDQKVWSLEQSYLVFQSRYHRLYEVSRRSQRKSGKDGKLM
jgi:ubiquitin-like 1-activating enzyme E1 B